MHNSFFFLQKLSSELNLELNGFSIVSCFSQDKDELVIELNNRSKSFFIKAHLHADFCCLSFPTSFARARKNSVDLFSETLMKEVLSVRQFQNERSFAMTLQDGLTLLFKMHGSRANIVLFQGGKAIAIFRNHLKPDLEIDLDSLDRRLDWTYPYFQEHQSDLKKGFFTLGNEAWEYLNNTISGGFQQLPTEQQWESFHALHEKLTSGKFFIIKKDKGISLSLFPQGEIVQEHFNGIKAISEFFLLKMKSGFADSGKAEALKVILEKEKQTIRYIEKNRALLQSLQHDQQYQLWANLIMANLYPNPDPGPLTPEGGTPARPGDVKRVEKIVLSNYRDGGKPVEIKLKKELSLQKNAEEYYRKAKNQKIEIEKLSESIQQKETELSQLLESKEKLNRGENSTSLKKEIASIQKDTVRLPYKEIEFNGFLIRIGKSAKDNDELTLKHAHKEDLWLHAKDVSGSHVVVQHQSGKAFPKDVIERAAELAALNSKRKGESLCPVAVTTKKFVRKRKGDPAGLVVVEREKVVMVVPR